ncbi:MAG: CGNR zinc finger domain-containing protein [Gemmatimonadota bacterium]
MIEPHWSCLELLKTRGWEARDRADDVLDSPAQFVAWTRKEGLVPAPEARRLRAAVRADPQAIAGVVRRTRELRTLLHRIFGRVAEDELPDDEDLKVLERTLLDADQRLALLPDADGSISWQWNGREEGTPAEKIDQGDLDAAATRRIVGGLARSAADLLTTGELARVKICDAHDCGWFFVDVSRNKSRRWCDMAGCGNRAKAQRYRERHG